MEENMLPPQVEESYNKAVLAVDHKVHFHAGFGAPVINLWIHLSVLNPRTQVLRNQALQCASFNLLGTIKWSFGTQGFKHTRVKEIELWFLKIIENNWSKFGKSHEKDFRKKVNLLAQNLSGVKILDTHIEKALKKLGITEKMLPDWSEDDKMNFA